MNKVRKRPILAILGPTAAGKTDLGLALAQRAPVSLISIDSVMIYRGMDVGSGKPDRNTLAAYPHALVDVLAPEEPYSASRCVADVQHAIALAEAAGRVPCLVGGTMMYFQALMEGLAPQLPHADPVWRKHMERELAEQGVLALYQKLQAIDPKAAARIHPNDQQRLLRFLEINALTGHHVPATRDASQGLLAQRSVVAVSLNTHDRSMLHQRIEQRFHGMLAQGFEAEVQQLLADQAPSFRNTPAMRSVGYCEMAHYLDGGCDHPTMVARALAATRQLAKKQNTWLRRWSWPRPYFLDHGTGLSGALDHLMEGIKLANRGKEA